jgi:hypothetical protein
MTGSIAEFTFFRGISLSSQARADRLSTMITEIAFVWNGFPTKFATHGSSCPPEQIAGYDILSITDIVPALQGIKITDYKANRHLAACRRRSPFLAKVEEKSDFHPLGIEQM